MERISFPWAEEKSCGREEKDEGFSSAAVEPNFFGKVPLATKPGALARCA